MYSISNSTKAVIFDLDGTLMDSMWIWKDIDKEYLAGFGHDVPAGLQNEIGGVSIYETAVYFKERFNIPDSYEKMMDDWNKMAWDKYTHEVFPKKGAELFIERCRNKGVKLAIASSNSRELIDQVLKCRGLCEAFDVVITGSEIVKGKPDPEIYITAMKKLGVTADECIVFEDIIPGIMAAKNAGIPVVAVYDEMSEEYDVEKRELSTAFINDFTEICFDEKVQ